MPEQATEQQKNSSIKEVAVQQIWLRLLLVMFVLVLAILGVHNYLVDPYRFFNSPTINNVNALKTYGGKIRIRKPIRVRQEQPTTLILGSSRGGRGLSCKQLQKSDGCYNASFKGITPYELLRSTEHSLVVSDIERMILQFSFITFNEHVRNKDGYDDEMLARPERGLNFALRKKHFEKKLYALFSYEAWRDARHTVNFQNKRKGWFSTGVWHMDADGSWEEERAVDADPEWLLSQQRKRWSTSYKRIDGNLADLARTLQKKPQRFDYHYKTFAKLLDQVYARGIKVDIVLPPSHEDILLALNRYELWPHVERWKRQIIAVNERVAAQYGVEPYPVWDFGGFHHYATEPNWEQLELGQEMQWFVDVVHFNRALGGKMLGAVESNQLQGDWYQVIHSGNIEQHLQQLRSQKNRYVKLKPPDKASGSGENE